MLQINNLSVQIAEKNVLHDINLTVMPGTVHALMGPNGSGKSSLAYSIMGHPSYVITNGSITMHDTSIENLTPDKRARAGLFLSFQQPCTLPGVKVHTFLLEIYRAVTGSLISIQEFKVILETYMTQLSIDPSFAYRNMNDGFSGGEKKKGELLQLLLLKPAIAILDEIDSGLDIDALKLVTAAINQARACNPTMSILIITHYQRMLNYIMPDHVYIISDGRILTSGGPELVQAIEHRGYHAYQP